MNFSIEELRAFKQGLLKLLDDVSNGSLAYPLLGICGNLIEEPSCVKAYFFIAGYSYGWEYRAYGTWPIPITTALWEGEGKDYRVSLMWYLIDKIDAELQEQEE